MFYVPISFCQLKAELKSIHSHHRAERSQIERQLQDAKNRASTGEENLKKEVHGLKSIINDLQDRLGKFKPDSETITRCQEQSIHRRGELEERGPWPEIYNK